MLGSEFHKQRAETARKRVTGVETARKRVPKQRS